MNLSSPRRDLFLVESVEDARAFREFIKVFQPCLVALQQKALTQLQDGGFDFEPVPDWDTLHAEWDKWVPGEFEGQPDLADTWRNLMVQAAGPFSFARPGLLIEGEFRSLTYVAPATSRSPEVEFLAQGLGLPLQRLSV